MEHLKDKEKFRIIKENEEQPPHFEGKETTPYFKKSVLVRYFEKLIFWLEVHIYNRIAKRVNWLLDRMKDDSFEITKDGYPINSNGNFKIEREGDNWEVKIKSGGTWTTVFIFYG